MKRLVAALALALSAAALPAEAGQLVDVSVRDLDNGQWLKVYPSRGKFYIAGVPGHRYAVNVANRTHERLMTVVSVDGVNTVTGETASTSQSGYVLDSYQSAEIKGWRKSMSESAEFYFTSVPDSYAARTDRPGNVGVIGVAVFREKRHSYAPPPIAEEDRRYDDPGYDDGPYTRSKDRASADSTAAAPPAAEAEGRASAPAAGPADSAKSLGSSGGAYARQAPASPSPRRDLGTGHGDRRYDPVTYTQFERASSSPDEVIALNYNDYRALVDAGIVPRHRTYRDDRAPNPFPTSFAPDPWR